MSPAFAECQKSTSWQVTESAGPGAALHRTLHAFEARAVPGAASLHTSSYSFAPAEAVPTEQQLSGHKAVPPTPGDVHQGQRALA